MQKLAIIVLLAILLFGCAGQLVRTAKEDFRKSRPDATLVDCGVGEGDGSTAHRKIAHLERLQDAG